MSYLLDTNVFLEANKRYYGLDFCPVFWDWLRKHENEGNLYSIRPVYDELKDYGDNLAEWVKGYDSFFQPIFDAECQKNFRTIVNLCGSTYDLSHRKNEHFLDSADPWLIAKAMVDGSTVVTEEKFAKEAKKIIIPNLCRELGVEYIDTFELLREFDDCFR
jgi:hypothetical protein